MRKVALVVMLGLLSGCMGAGPTPEQQAELDAVTAENSTLVAAHKITHVEAANRYNAAIERQDQGRVPIVNACLWRTGLL
jgi:hypothetical protein